MRRHEVVAALLLLLTVLLTVVSAFNIDVKGAVVHRHNADTYFGYSIDIYQDSVQSLYALSSIHCSLCRLVPLLVCRLLVGAPKAQSDQPNVRKGGAVFRCAVDKRQCSPIYFDRDGE